MYGKYFKRLRNYKKLSLREAADGITSSPALSRWENEADDIRLQKFLALLHRVDVTPREFFAYTELQGNVENSYYETIHLLARQKNAHRLYQIYLRQISRFHQTHDPDRLGKAVAADNFCFQLTQKNTCLKLTSQSSSTCFKTANTWILRRYVFWRTLLICSRPICCSLSLERLSSNLIILRQLTMNYMWTLGPA
jgi:transcriptional regulator with XRE-family HTH domain